MGARWLVPTLAAAAVLLALGLGLGWGPPAARAAPLPTGRAETTACDAQSDGGLPTDGDCAPAAVPLAASGAPGAAAGPGALAPLEAALFARVNADRAAAGQPPLGLDAALVPAARSRAADQAPLPDLSHDDPSGQRALAGLLAAAGPRYVLAGENLVRLPGADAGVVGRAEEALLARPAHRANLLRPEYDYLAAGAAHDLVGRTTFAQLFWASA